MRRMIPPGARVEIWAPIQAPGTAPSSSDVATANEKSPNSRWPAAAEPTSGIACTRSVPTSADALRRRVHHAAGHHHDRAGPDRRQADHEPGDRPEDDRRHRPDHDRRAARHAGDALARAAGGCATSGSAPGRRARPSRAAARAPGPRLRSPRGPPLAGHLADQPRAGEGRRHRPDAQPPTSRGSPSRGGGGRTPRRASSAGSRRCRSRSPSAGRRRRRRRASASSGRRRPCP